VLENFEEISGLGCNLEKTSLMPVGELSPLEQEVREIGLQIVSEITLLGSVIKNTGVCYEQNSSIILEKVRKQVNFWKRFNLSLPGRINVTKTFMYSQVNYLGCFLPMGEKFIKDVSGEIERFVKGSMQIGRQKIYESIENGGLGMFRITDFLASQCCAWVRRSVTLDEIWKKDLYKCANGMVFNLRKKHFDRQKNPILHHIASCFEKFIYGFTCYRENFKQAYIYENPCLTFDNNNNNYLQQNFLTGDEFILYGKSVRALTLDKILNPDYTTKGKQEFEASTNIFLTEIKYNRLRLLAINVVRKYKKVELHEITTDKVDNFCMRIRRGSKKYRLILAGKEVERI